MTEKSLMFKNLLNASNQYDLVSEDEIEIKVNGTMILKCLMAKNGLPIYQYISRNKIFK